MSALTGPNNRSAHVLKVWRRPNVVHRRPDDVPMRLGFASVHCLPRILLLPHSGRKQKHVCVLPYIYVPKKFLPYFQKIEQAYFTRPLACLKSCWMSGTQSWPWSEAAFCTSDLGLHCLLTSLRPNTAGEQYILIKKEIQQFWTGKKKLKPDFFLLQLKEYL